MPVFNTAHLNIAVSGHPPSFFYLRFVISSFRLTEQANNNELKSGKEEDGEVKWRKRFRGVVFSEVTKRISISIS